MLCVVKTVFFLCHFFYPCIIVISMAQNTKSGRVDISGKCVITTHFMCFAAILFFMALYKVLQT